ncbi:MAG TPA: SsrA-binding protein SmpB [bacterium]|nr:SsrA-binding protein SmpB [Dictyoglomota bacterium]HHV81411.1 SsrA-binding protein SmpB [bacterium]HOK29275.1 SsrA-binding protein SmpB [bacterium]HOL54288.1 SsrA-binding protein SmpB [bacterium]HON73177.1 SsrA-binding protein SmpB [bacterium]
MEEGERVVTVNRKAYHDYDIEETLEAGIVLSGTEVKSLRRGSCNLRDSFVQIKDGEAWIINMHIAPYKEGGRYNLDPDRTRKLLLHREEIEYLASKSQIRGYSIIPLKVYFKRGRAKLELALAKGRKLVDKKRVLIERDKIRELERTLKEYTGA